MGYRKPKPELQAVLKAGSHLGETPVWDVDRGVLWWIDVYKPTINRFDPRDGGNGEIALDQSVHAIGLRRNGGIVASLEHGFGFVDATSGQIEIICNPLGDAAVKFNDGKCDRHGRFWSGSMANDWVSPIGSLYRLDPDRSARTLDTGFKLSNGMGWSPDDRRMYFTDFGRSTVFVYDYDAASGAIGGRQPLVVIPEAEGRPDGMAVDEEGCLWVVLWDGWAIARFDPAGRLIGKVSLPVQRPTSCAFGGRNLSTLYVTSATMQLSGKDLSLQPLAGSLFAIESGTRGLPEGRFGT
jgi:sugar lactone lactonase YvrE